MSCGKYVIGVDFGTLSGRAVLADVSSGRIIAQKERQYTHGVITQLPGGRPLGAGWALQDPGDYLQVLEETIPALLRETGVPGGHVAALGFDVTSCTILPATEDGTPLCRTEAYRDQPHAYVKLWKHHGAYGQARRIEEWANRQQPDLLKRYGGKVSSQWMLPRVLQILEEAPEIYRESSLILEVVDWLPLQLTGQLRRNTCCAGFKNLWEPDTGYPPEAFFVGLDERLADLVPEKLRGETAAPWEPVGQLTPEWAQRLGLTTDTVVASGIIDAHAGVLGSGVTGPDKLLMILGTSACHLLLSPKEVMIPGICGSCRDSILPGYYAYEAGQACVGDMLDWFVRNNVPEERKAEADARGLTVHQLLTQRASRLAPGESGLLALDWWNGQRTPLVDDQLTGVMVGMTIHTTAAEQYRALLESAAFGTRLILEVFGQAGIDAPEIVACGGIARKNELMMQIYADVLQRPIRVADSDQCSALGAAILAAVAAGIFGDPAQAVQSMTRPGELVYRPQPEHAAVYQAMYQEFKALVSYFGESGVMRNLYALRGKGAR